MTELFDVCQDKQPLSGGCHDNVKRETRLVKYLRNHGILQEKLERHDLQCRLMGRLKNHRACSSRALNLQPPRCAYAPAVTWLEPRKTELRHRRGKVVPQLSRNPQKLFGNDAAQSVHSEVFGTGLTASIAEEAGHRLGTACLQRLAQNILRDRTACHFHGTILNLTAEALHR